MAITRAQAEASNMIEGIIPIYDYSARVLFDSGASHSFISEEFLDCIVHPLEEKSCELVVEVPSGEFLLTSSYIDEAPRCRVGCMPCSCQIMISFWVWIGLNCMEQC